MTEVHVVANLPVLGLRKGQEVTVELTELIQGALDGGKLSLVVPDPAPEPPAAVVDAPKPKEGRGRGDRASDDAPGGDS